MRILAGNRLRSVSLLLLLIPLGLSLLATCGCCLGLTLVLGLLL